MKKIALVGLYYENNLGDPLMVECVEYMYKKIAKSRKEELSFTYVDLFGRESKTDLSYYNQLGTVQNLFRRLLSVTGRITQRFLPNKYNKIQYLKWKSDPNLYKRYQKYFREKLKDVDMVVVVGGALVKFKLIRDFHNPIHTLIDVAKEFGINVYLNAIGVENGYDGNDFGCQTVKNYLNYSNVKMITTRDDISTLHQYVSENKIPMYKVADTAVWCDEIFDMDLAIDSDIVGIGLLEPTRFIQYEQGITEEYYTDLIINIANKLTKKGVKWKFFTNGHVGDYEFGLKILKLMNLEENKLVSRPLEYTQLLETINGFKAIIASRLHACIIAYSLNKVVIGLDWNDKLLFFGNEIRHPERFFKPKDVDAERVVNVFEKAVEQGYDQEFRNEYRQTINKSIEESFEFIK